MDSGVGLKCRPPAWGADGRLGCGGSGREEWGRGQAGAGVDPIRVSACGVVPLARRQSGPDVKPGPVGRAVQMSSPE